MREIIVSTAKKREVVDITEQIESLLIEKVSSSFGAVHLFATHTTVALSIADLDPGTDLDMLDAFEQMIPHLAYRHPHDPEHTPDHILSALIGPSILVPFSGGRLMLGTWQRIVLFEFDGPRERHITVTVLQKA